MCLSLSETADVWAAIAALFALAFAWATYVAAALFFTGALILLLEWLGAIHILTHRHA